MRAVLMGASGMLGHDLIASAPPEVTLYPFTRTDVDITQPRQVERAIGDCKPELVLNAAAYTKVDEAEGDARTAFAVNAVGPGEIGRAAARVGARVVHYGTDYVFDGRAKAPYREHDQTNPLSVYGASKLEGEQNLRRSGVEYLIVRTQWLFGARGPSFPRTMWERSVRRSPSRVVADQVGRPTYAVDLARATWKLVALGVSGVIHVANAGIATWYDVAKRVYSASHADDLVEPCSTAELSTLAKRPLWSVLSTAHLEQVLGGPLPPWEDAIHRFLVQMQASTPPSPTKG